MAAISLGIIGLSEGNGHPYSWPAIFNGYNHEFMKDCPYPVIHEYLSKQTFPDDCIKETKVTHIWTQDKKLSEHIAKASNIPNIVETYTDLIGKVDGILLARDDVENHYEMAKPFIEAGMPVYIDKPIAFSIAEAYSIYNLEKYSGQIFTCSAISFAEEFQITEEILKETGEILYIDACVMKDWDKYSIHIIEPVLKMLDKNDRIINITTNSYNKKNTVAVNWESGITACFKTLGDSKCPIKIIIYGTSGYKELVFNDTFAAFKSALQNFVDIINNKKPNLSKNITIKTMEIIERGRINGQ